MRIQELLSSLFHAFPAEDAEGWDHVGLQVGDPDAEIARVCCALDATEAYVREAASRGANVLLTHHPVYIKAPDAFTPAAAVRPSSGTVIYEAARLGVSILSFHTNLDRSFAARDVLPVLVDLRADSSLEFPDDPSRHGLGAVCQGCGCTLRELAIRVADAFGTEPRVWGDPGAIIERPAFLGGSLGDLGELAIAADAQAVVCGEAGYHIAQDLSIRGCAVILLGHDRSEEPFTGILADAARSAGIAPAAIDIIHGHRQWWTATEGGTVCPAKA